MNGFYKTVFHVHTDYSDDSNSSVAELLTDALRLGVDCVTVTDHDSIEAGLALAELAGSSLKVIVGEEVSTRDGHVIGLFLTERIEPGMPARDTAEAIKGQGGLVIVPHPFNRLFGCSLRHRVHDLIDLVDAIEVCNAQNLLPFPHHRAEALAARSGIPRIVGSDMHHRGYLDSCYQWMPRFDGPASFLTALSRARIVRGRHPLFYFARTARYLLYTRLGFRPPAGYGRNCPANQNRHALSPP